MTYCVAMSLDAGMIFASDSRTNAGVDQVACIGFGRTSRFPSILLSTKWDSLTIRMQRRIEESDPHFQMVHTHWGEGLRKVFTQLPNPDWT
jgi:predicted proteasome-type protease